MPRSISWCFVVCLLITPFATGQEDGNAEAKTALAALKPFLGHFASEVWTSANPNLHGQAVTEGYLVRDGSVGVFDTRLRTTSADNELQQIGETPFGRALRQRIVVFSDAKRGLVYHRLHAGWGMYDQGTVKRETNGTLTWLSSEPPTGYLGDLRRVQWTLVGDTLEFRGAPAPEKLPEKPNWRTHRTSDESSVKAIPLDRSRLRPPTTVSPEEQKKREEAQLRLAKMFEPFGHLSTDYYVSPGREFVNRATKQRFFAQMIRLVRRSPSKSSISFSINFRGQPGDLPKEELKKKAYFDEHQRVHVMRIIHWNHRKQRMQQISLNPLRGVQVRDVRLTPEHKFVLSPAPGSPNVVTLTFQKDRLLVERTDKDGKPLTDTRSKSIDNVVEAEQITGLSPKP